MLIIFPTIERKEIDTKIQCVRISYILATFFLLLPIQALAFEGRVVRVVDGDTIKVMPTSNVQKMQLGKKPVTVEADGLEKQEHPNDQRSHQ